MNLVSHMKTKKALGALLGLLGSLPAFPFLPLAGFSAPLLFTANLNEATRRTEKKKSQKHVATRRNRTVSVAAEQICPETIEKQERGVVILTWHRPWRRPWIWPPSWRIPAETPMKRSDPCQSGGAATIRRRIGGRGGSPGRGEGKPGLALGGEREEETERGGRSAEGRG